MYHSSALLLLFARHGRHMADAFRAALLALSGSRASVQTAAAFFAVPGAAPACTSALCAHAAELSGADCFVGRLRILFVANEGLALGAAGVTEALLAGLPALLRLAASAAADADALDKLSALVRLWETRAMVPAQAVPALLLAAGGGQAGAAQSDPAVPAGALPALVRRAGAAYTPLPRAEAQHAAARGIAEAQPTAAAREYFELRMHAFYEAASGSGKRGRPFDAAVVTPHEMLPAPARGVGSHVGVGGPHSDADAFRRAKSEAYYSAVVTNK
jgi:hypothetical protein